MLSSRKTIFKGARLWPWEGRPLCLLSIPIWLELQLWKGKSSVLRKREAEEKDKRSLRYCTCGTQSCTAGSGLHVRGGQSGTYFSHCLTGLSTSCPRYNPGKSTSWEKWECSLCTRPINRACHTRSWGELTAPNGWLCLPVCSHWNILLRSLTGFGALLSALAVISPRSTPISLSFL